MLALLETSESIAKAFIILARERNFFLEKLDLSLSELLSKVQRKGIRKAAIQGDIYGRHLCNKILFYIFSRAISREERYFSRFITRTFLGQRYHDEFPATKSDPIQLARCSITTGINQAANVSVCTA